MSPIERAARAICKTRSLNGGIDDDGWNDAPHELRAEYLNMSRAAAAAMRAPSRSMVRAGRCSLTLFEGACDDDAIDCWQEMLDSMLEEKVDMDPKLLEFLQRERRTALDTIEELSREEVVETRTVGDHVTDAKGPRIERARARIAEIEEILKDAGEDPE